MEDRIKKLRVFVDAGVPRTSRPFPVLLTGLVLMRVSTVGSLGSTRNSKDGDSVLWDINSLLKI